MSLRSILGLLLGAALFVGFALGDEAEERRKKDLALLLKLLPPTSRKITGRINAHDKSWREWQARTGELPPDFTTMESIPELPDPLRVGPAADSPSIRTPAQWSAKRDEIRKQFEQWVYGSVPPDPDNLRATVVSERTAGEITIREVLLEFGPEYKAKLRLELLLPPGEQPRPVFLTNHARTRPWVLGAVRRGYIGCVYFAADPRYGYEDDSESYIEAYPEHDFSTVARWGWSASRAVDYLMTLPAVDQERIALTGHSRNGKQALFAAAFDPRIAAVVPSSGNTGEGNPWRYTSDIFRNESIEQITGSFPHWFHPRLRFFVGREDKLPVDQNSLMSLVAPRGLMLATAYSETQGNTLGFEQAYRSVRRVYELLGKPENVSLYVRPGIHATTAGVIEDYLDFFDSVFARSPEPPPEHWTHGYRFEDWRAITGENVDPAGFPVRALGDMLTDEDGGRITAVEDWDERREEIHERLRWALGDEPPGAPFPARESLEGLGITSDGFLGDLHGRPLKIAGAGATELPFGDDLQADFYYPGADGRPARKNLPVVVWLHPYAYSTGYSRYAKRPFEALIKRGFGVLAFDQIGFGTRVLDAKRFYARYPRWSLLGKMVADTRAAVDALTALGASGTVDPKRIYLVGYSLGAKVGLFSSALDERVAGVASVNGFTPLRLASGDKGTEGIRHYSHLHGLAPRLGFFLGGEEDVFSIWIGHERRLPIDYDDVLALIAPRPVLVSAATHDRYAPVEDVKAATEAARQVYALHERSEALTLHTPEDFNRFGAERQKEVFDWLSAL